ncbi:MAG: aldo/keto reductase [Defluviitaleaceae bacterium]|nr:aldo/keto reductase [Defluviitaleaceae bacterium]
MEYRSLGKSKIMIHPIGMGCWAYGGGAYWGAQAQSDVDYVVSAALDSGVNFFDTAEMYNAGDSEISLGKALRGKRGRAVVATKVSPANCRKAAMTASLDKSLSRLGMDYVDLYMIHWPFNYISLKHFTEDKDVLDNPPDAAEAFGTLAELKKQGKIKSIGVSNFGVTQIKDALATGVSIDVNEVTYNLFSRAIEKEILPFCRDNQISVIGSMALQQGILAGIYPDVESIPKPQAHSRHFHHSRGAEQSRHTSVGAEAEMFAALGEINAVCSELNMPIARLAVAWVLAQKGVSASLVGSRTKPELESNLLAASVALPDDVLRRLDLITKPVLEKLGDNADYYEDDDKSRIF